MPNEYCYNRVRVFHPDADVIQRIVDEVGKVTPKLLQALSPPDLICLKLVSRDDGGIDVVENSEPLSENELRKYCWGTELEVIVHETDSVRPTLKQYTKNYVMLEFMTLGPVVRLFENMCRNGGFSVTAIYDDALTSHAGVFTDWKQLDCDYEDLHHKMYKYARPR